MNKYFAEFIGTFILVSVILNFPTNNPIYALAVGLALAVAIFLGGKFSGGHFNPAVSVAKYVQGELSSTDVILYPLSQLIGGLVAYLLHSGGKGESIFKNVLSKDSPVGDVVSPPMDNIDAAATAAATSDGVGAMPDAAAAPDVGTMPNSADVVASIPDAANAAADAAGVGDTDVLGEGPEFTEGAKEEQAGGFLTGFNNLNNTPIYA